MDNKVEELLIDWQLARDGGVARTPEEICQNCPELLPDLVKAIEELSKTDWLFDFVDASANESSPGHSNTKKSIEFEAGTMASKINQLGLVPSQKIQATLEAISDSVDTNTELLRQLHRQALLTDYQADVLQQRKKGPLVIDRYQILGIIGSGGMGQVYRARQVSMNREVAIKVVADSQHLSRVKRERFIREIESVAKLSHPNIVTAFDACPVGDELFLAMELFEGEDLHRTIRKQGPIELKRALEITRQIAEAAGFAHQHGIIHRDIKPANILVANTSPPKAKLLDLGVARVSSNLDSPHDQSTITTDKVPIGTVAFMAPEQATDPSKADERSDMYSLGCTLYFMLCGELVSDDANPLKILVAHRERPVESLLDRPEIDSQSKRLLEKMMAKAPTDRFASMDQLVFAIQEQQSTPLLNPPESRTGPSAYLPIGVFAASILLAILAAVAIWNAGVREGGPAPSNIRSPMFENDLARWAINEGGIVVANTEFGLQELEDTSAIPEHPIQITSLTLYSVPQEFDYQTLGSLKRLQSLTIEDSALSTSLVNAINATQIEDLGLIRCNVGESFVELIGQSDHLTSFRFEQDRLPGRTIETVVAMKNLRKLALRCPEINDDLLLPLRSINHLETLDLSNTSIGAETLRFAFLSTKLVSLDLTDTPISDSDIENLPISRSLEMVSLDFCDIGASALKSIAKTPNLRQLYLEATNVDDEAVLALTACKNLEYLDLSNTSITGSCLPELKELTKLETLDLSGTKMADDLLLGVTQLPALKDLRLSEMKISRKVFEGISKLELTGLELSGSSYTESALDKFVAENPDCLIWVTH